MANISSLGDRALVVRLGDRIDRETFRRVYSLARQLEDNRVEGMIEYVPAFTTVTIHYDPLRRTALQMREAIEQAISQLDVVNVPPQRAVSIPVCYGGGFGEDIEFVAQQRGLTQAEVIEIHCGVEYLVYMLGFAPGFPYLGGMSSRIATPRRDSPRVKTPAGSVGIAGEQTGVY
ncbi:MAG: 5-oxoprolinase subunit PxpB, partial [Planctomycetota bacterium]